MMAPPDLRRTVSPIAKPMGAVPDADQGVWHRQNMFQPLAGREMSGLLLVEIPRLAATYARRRGATRFEWATINEHGSLPVQYRSKAILGPEFRRMMSQRPMEKGCLLAPVFFTRCY
jgi:hypothetical protein